MENRVLVFDLDDTLYLERDFAISGFKAAGAWYQALAGFAGLSERCGALFENGHRGKIFDQALQEIGAGCSEELVSQLVGVYRSHRPDISLAADALRFLQRFRGRCRLAVITDGPAATQMAKVRALGVDRLVEKIIYTDEWGRDFWKPHPRAFEAIEAWSGELPSRHLYVADNPLKDFVTPRARGWATVQIVRDGRVHTGDAQDPAYMADALLPDLDALATHLAGDADPKEGTPLAQC